MNVNIENTSELRRKMTIELELVEINREFDKTYNELRRGVQIKGFRPGRAPRIMLERMFGDQVRSDVIQKLIKEYTGKALEEHDLKPVVEPEIVTEETDLKKSLRFSAVFDLKPQLTVKDYQDLKVPKAPIEVTEEEVDAELERIRQRHATLKKVEGRNTVQDDDFVLAEFEGYDDGKPLPGTKVDDRLVNVSKQTLAHGLDEVLAGAEIGAEVRKVRNYPADYSEKEIAGKSVEWRATVKEIYTRVLPDLDDEFAKDNGVQNLAELREQARKALEEQARQEADGRSRQGLLDLIMERNPVELPESLVAREQRSLESEIASIYEAAGASHEEALAKARGNPEELYGRAQRRARVSLIVDAIADQENVEVSDDEVADRVAQMVTRSGRQRDRMAEFYRQEENRAALKQSMRREKALDLLLSRAQTQAETPGEAPANP
jgi:trigger factor